MKGLRHHDMTIYERPLAEGWVYPCSAADIRARLATVPLSDLDGLWAVGLAPGPRKRHFAYATYYGGDRPTIGIFAGPRPYGFRMLPHTKPHQIDRWYRDELAFGMQVVQAGSRYEARWEPEGLRRYVVDHILLHEIGHHVFRKAYGFHPGWASESYADDYARRHRRQHGLITSDTDPSVP